MVAVDESQVRLDKLTAHQVTLVTAALTVCRPGFTFKLRAAAGVPGSVQVGGAQPVQGRCGCLLQAVKCVQ